MNRKLVDKPLIQTVKHMPPSYAEELLVQSVTLQSHYTLFEEMLPNHWAASGVTRSLEIRACTFKIVTSSARFMHNPIELERLWQRKWRRRASTVQLQNI